MLDTNVGDMPIDIFGDYISDCLGIEFTWEYLVPILNFYPYFPNNHGGGIYKNSGTLGDGFERSYYGIGEKYLAYNDSANGDHGQGSSFGNSYTTYS